MLIAIQFGLIALLLSSLVWLGDQVGESVDSALGQTRMRDRYWGAK